MSLVENNFHTDLAAHYSAVRRRLWAGPSQVPPTVTAEEWDPIFGLPPPPPPEPNPVESEPPARPSVEQIAAKWREIDTRVFGSRVSPKSVLFVMAAYFELDVETLVGERQTIRIARPRQYAMYVMQRLCRCSERGGNIPLSLSLIAQQFRRHHATTFRSIKNVRKRMSKDPAAAKAIADVIDLLKR